MREFGKIYSRFWTSPDIVALSDQGKLLACYLMTCSHGNITGLYRLPNGYVTDDLGWSPETVGEGFYELFANGFIDRDEATGWTLVHRFLKWNRVENPNQGKAFEKMFDQIPEVPMKSELAAIALEFVPHLREPFRNRLETVSEPFRNKQKEKESKERERLTPATVVPAGALPGQGVNDVF